MNVAPLESPLASSPLLGGVGELDNALSLGLAPPGIGADNIARFVAPQLQNTGFTNAGPSSPQPIETDLGQLGSAASQMSNPLTSMLAQLMQMMQMMMSSLGLGSPYGGGYGGGYGSGYGSGYGGGYGSGYGGGCPQYGNEQYYSSAAGASQGDPHLSFNGNTWDNMTSQPNLLQSNSFQGGYQISTQVGAPMADGHSYNQSATITLNGGAATVGMNNAGQASIQEYGQNIPISPGQTVQLGNGENVTCNQNGSLTVQAQNGQGGQITTTLTAKGPGVNVDVSAQNVDLGGSLVNGNGGCGNGGGNAGGNGIVRPSPIPTALPFPSALPFPAPMALPQLPPLPALQSPFSPQQNQQQPYPF